MQNSTIGRRNYHCLNAASRDNRTIPLNKHFVIADARQRLPNGWRETDSLGWWIGRGADLRLYPLRKHDGTDLGAVLGWVVGEDGLLPDGAALHGPKPGESIAAWASDLSGRFLCLVRSEGGAQVVLDAGGLLGAVYDRNCRAIASIPSLLPGGSIRDDDLVAKFRVPERHGWYPFGLTPARGVERLLPNFALALNDFSTRRIWPVGSEAIRASSPDKAVPAMVAMTAAIARGLWRGGNLVAHLTAGYDSRMVLAALGAEAAAQVPVITIALPDRKAALDVHVAARLAERFDLAHEIRPYIPASQEDIRLWQMRTGECISDIASHLSRTLANWPANQVELTGTGGEVSRAFYWNRKDMEEPPPDPDEILRRLEMPRGKRIRLAVEEWLSSLPPADAVRVWDLIYIEQRLGCWAGPEGYGSPQRTPAMAPFNNRRVFEAMLSLPNRYRLNGRLSRDFIAEGWPELNEHPFNRAVGLDQLRFPRALMKSALPAPVFARLKRMKSTLASARKRSP